MRKYVEFCRAEARENRWQGYGGLDVTTLSLRRLWTMYKQILADGGMRKRDLILAQNAFYSGARSVLQVLGHLAEHDEYEELHRAIKGQRRQIKALQGLRPRSRRH